MSEPALRGANLNSNQFAILCRWMVPVLAIAAVLRFFRLGAKSFWLDEAASATLARIDGHTFWQAIFHRQANMALYYALLRGWALLGRNEFAIRSFSVFAGLAAIPAIYLLSARLFGPRAGRISAILLAVHAFHIRYSQEARGYSLCVLLGILSSWLFLRALEESSRRNWTLYVIVSTLMVYAQVFGGWVLLAQWVSVLFFRDRLPLRKGCFAAAAAIGLLVAPLAYCLLVVSDRTQLAWLAPPTPQDFYKFCLAMTGDAGLILLLAYLAMVVVAIMRTTLLRSQPHSSDTWKICFLLTWLILPVASVLAISLRWPAFEPRFLIPSLPALIVLVAVGISRIRKQIVFSAVLLAILGLSLSGVCSYLRARTEVEHTDNWRDATRYVVSQGQPGDTILFIYSEERLAFDEYLSLTSPVPVALHEFPEKTAFQLLTERPSRPTPELLDRIANGYNRVWVLTAFRPNAASRPSEDSLATRFVPRLTHNFGFVRVESFVDKISCPQNEAGVCR